MELINPLQRKILQILSSRPESELFYLAGGTALSAFYLKHRQSRDLDFFTTEENAVVPFSFVLERMLVDSGCRVQRSRSFPSFAELLVKELQNETVVQFAVDSPYRIAPVVVEEKEIPGLRVDNLADLAANKLLALFGRAMVRDFIDIYFVVTENHFTWDELIQNARKKDPGFNLY